MLRQHPHDQNHHKILIDKEKAHEEKLRTMAAESEFKISQASAQAQAKDAKVARGEGELRSDKKI